MAESKAPVTTTNARQQTPPPATPRINPPLPPTASPTERLLWTPTEGQDLTKSLFPLSPTPAKP